MAFVQSQVENLATLKLSFGERVFYQSAVDGRKSGNIETWFW
jgi:hypothetical protein